MKQFVLYHDDADGYASAMSAYLKFGLSARYIPVQYGQDFPLFMNDLTKEMEIYILDFSYKKELLKQVNSLVGKLVVLDHHDTAEQELSDLYYARFDKTKSGCLLSWEYFHPDEPIPFIIKIVNDRDLWLFNIKESRAFDLGMRATGSYNKIKFWKEVYDSNCLLLDILEKGLILEEDLNARVSSIVNNPSKYKRITTNWFDGNEYKIVVTNINNDISEIGSAFNNKLDIDFSVTYFITNDGKVILSLRSNNKCNLHLGEISKIKDGGGHRLAAGISLPLDKGIEFLNMVYSS